MSEINFPDGQIAGRSVVTEQGTTYFLARIKESGGRVLGIQGDTSWFTSSGVTAEGIAICPLTAENARALRARLVWLNPVPLGLKTSFGFGDRIGAATPGHIHALKSADPAGKVAPIFAQQSVRENTRTGRIPQGVMDDATWGIFEEGWRAPWGADADHVKVLTDLDPFLAAGYTFFTIDPSDHVDNEAQTDALDALRAKTDHLPWDILQSSYADMELRYSGQPVKLDGMTLEFDETTLRRALVKYGRALAHAVTIADAISAHFGGKPFDLEMSVDETDTPTSAHEHFFIASELARCNVPVVSLAPRFVGKFQKGVDYIGDTSEFEGEFVKHAAIMHHFGTYKLSIHTGSDKFSIYPAIAKHTRGLVHVKTAGTSYLEALRIAAGEPELFRQMLEIARAQFEKDRKTYFLDAQLDKVPAGKDVNDADLPALLDHFDTRQVLHVTFGSILGQCGGEMNKILNADPAGYAAALEAHFIRHIAPFA